MSQRVDLNKHSSLQLHLRLLLSHLTGLKNDHSDTIKRFQNEPVFRLQLVGHHGTGMQRVMMRGAVCELSSWTVTLCVTRGREIRRGVAGPRDDTDQIPAWGLTRNGPSLIWLLAKLGPGWGERKPSRLSGQIQDKQDTNWQQHTEETLWVSVKWGPSKKQNKQQQKHYEMNLIS